MQGTVAQSSQLRAAEMAARGRLKRLYESPAPLPVSDGDGSVAQAPAVTRPALPPPAPAAPRISLGTTPLLLIALALGALATQVELSFTLRQQGLPVLIAIAALALAAATIIVPAVKPYVLRAPAPELALLPLAGVAYVVSSPPLPTLLPGLVLPAMVLACGVAFPGRASMAWTAVLVLAAGYLHAIGAGGLARIGEPEVAGVPAMLVVTAAMLTVAARRFRQAEQRGAADASRWREACERLEADNGAIRQGTEAATAVLEVATGITAALDPGAIADQIVRGTGAQLRAVGTVLLLWDEASETFRVGAIHGPHALGATDLRQVEVRPETVPTLGGDLSGSDVQVSPAQIREPMLRGLLQRWRVTGLLGVRLQRGDQLRGLLFAVRGDRQPPFSALDSRVLSGIALHAAAALEHANLIADLQSANQLKEEFMATMSHELRTPLNVIIGYTDLQIEGAFGDLPPDHLETLGTVRQQALQLLELIQATLDMSRLERGLLTVDLRDIAVGQLIEQLQVQIPPAWRKPAVDLNWRVAPGLPPIRTDPAKLGILLRNLVHNALKFTHHGMVTVSVSAHADRQQVTFVVQDSGIGIKAEHLSEIFEMFRQAPDGEATIGGVGLGLYIVKRLATVLGAEIEVSSAPGRGATFRIHVPINGPLASRA